jgi:hypothetical protein
VNVEVKKQLRKEREMAKTDIFVKSVRFGFG